MGIAPIEGFTKQRLQEIVGIVLLSDIETFHGLYEDCKIPYAEAELVQQVVAPIIESWKEKFLAQSRI